ncbi:MAG: 2OG-Fe(II) oxygenase [Ilumatobacteraceae bacterium]
MTNETTIQPSVAVDPLGVFDDARFAELAVSSAAAYQSAAPFPHGVYDDFLPADLAQELARSFPTYASIEWVVRDNENNRRVYQHDETRLPMLYRQMLREFNSRQFLLFAETLSGIDNLLPDPYFIGGGIHLSGPDDFLKIHADFNWHHKLQAYRRVNALLYLSEEWDDSWGGAIEFWDREMTGAVDLAYPKFNRLVVFSTSEHSNHGQRVPNACPPGVTRKVINLYYYTTHRDDDDAAADPHFTLYKTEASPFAMQLGEEYRASRSSD